MIAVVTGAGRGFGREIARGLAARGYTVLATDVDEEAAAETAELAGGWSMRHDVRDPEAHRSVAAAAIERGPLEVWVNNAGVLRTRRAWDHSDDEVRLQVEANLLGVIWGSRAAVGAMRERGGSNMHVINLGSMSAFAPVPGLAVYAATKHGVLGFSGSLQGDLMAAGLPIRVHVVCPDGADTAMTRERAGEPESAIIWSGPRMLTAEEVAARVMGLLDSEQLVLAIPRWRGWAARAAGLGGRHALRAAEPLRRQGERRRRVRARPPPSPHRPPRSTSRTPRPGRSSPASTSSGRSRSPSSSRGRARRSRAGRRSGSPGVRTCCAAARSG